MRCTGLPWESSPNSMVVPFGKVCITSIADLFAGVTIVKRIKLVKMPAQDEYVWNQAGRSLSDLGKGLQWLFPGAATVLTGQTPRTNWAVNQSRFPKTISPIPGSLPTGTRLVPDTSGALIPRSKGDVLPKDYPLGVPFSWNKGVGKYNEKGNFVWITEPRTGSNSVVSTPTTSPNTIVRRGDGQDGISDEYRSQLSAWENKRTAAAQALKGFQPGSGPMPAAATEAAQAGQELWAKLHPGLAKPGGAVGTYNPLMQARGDVPSMADLWSGMRSIQAPTAGPGRTSEDVTDEAMAKARAEGRYFEPSGTMGGFAPAADPATQQRMQQFGTAMQAQKGTEETSAAQRSQDFVNKFKLGSLNPGSYNFPGYDANAMMNEPSALFK